MPPQPSSRSSEAWDRSLTLVRAADRERSEAEARLAWRVGAARRDGHSWRAIGLVLGVSAQAAETQFGTPDVAGP
jgi:hypothetical protein